MKEAGVICSICHISKTIRVPVVSFHLPPKIWNLLLVDLFIIITEIDFCSAWDYSAWVRAYALFLEEKLECFRVLKYDIETERSVSLSLHFSSFSLFIFPHHNYSSFLYGSIATLIKKNWPLISYAENKGSWYHWLAWAVTCFATTSSPGYWLPGIIVSSFVENFPIPRHDFLVPLSWASKALSFWSSFCYELLKLFAARRSSSS